MLYSEMQKSLWEMSYILKAFKNEFFTNPETNLSAQCDEKEKSLFVII